MIATDMDGTFLSDQKGFDRTAFANLYRKWKANGTRFVIASGNQYQHLSDIFKDDDQQLDYIAENGALIVSNGQVLQQHTLAPQAVATALDLLETDPRLANALVILSGAKDAYISASASPEFFAEGAKYYRHLQPVEDLRQLSDRFFKIALAWPNQDVSNQELILRAALPELHVTSSGFGGIDIVPQGVNKGNAMRFLQTRWQISPAETAAFGDSNNDLELLTACTESYAMANANAKIKAVAKYITKHDNNNGGALRQMATL
ncbi:HAD superfamily hydrolase [Lacticaseibacillus manihotivorans DSM 13343 = JCM 12514]|uniref:HAD superfamily hydrolase n=2 Tax=Lacticaseibacillus manihotivorans TaxID=88233 RepID=A0A0R1R2T6_9LACO|nr:HAD superfamily hydrolase [Lacticaseibacillus manihotivorans DSM 13343 = JCM 12514]